MCICITTSLSFHLGGGVFTTEPPTALCVCLVTQLCLTLCDPMDYSPPVSSVHGFSRQEYWNRLPCLPPRDLPDPGIEPASPMAPVLQADYLLLSHQGTFIPHYPFVVQVAQSCPTLCHPMDCSRPRFPVFSLTPRVCAN